MRRAAVITVLMAITLLSVGCVSVSGPSLFRLPTTGGVGSGDTLAQPITENRASPHPEIVVSPNSNWEILTNERLAAAAQNHRTPRAKPPAHDFLTKPVAKGYLTSGHGYRANPLGISKPRKHNGIDYAAPKGTEIYAAGEGTVARIYRSKSYGNYIRIRHANGYATAYAHLNSYAKGMKVGAKVKRGQTIGTVGSTGRSTGNHLHFELIYKGRFVDPLSNTAASTFANSTVEPNTVSQN